MKSRDQLHIFFNALAFFSRIRVPAWVKFSPEHQRNACLYLPFIGIIIGTLCALVYQISHQIFAEELAVLLALATGVLLTGGLHEDGLADCADGFGAGWDKQGILRIMKDSQIGSYGVLALIFVLSAKYISLIQISNPFYALILGHSLSRLTPLLVMQQLAYVGSGPSSKAENLVSPVSRKTLAIAFLPVFITLLFAPHIYFYLAVVAVIVIAICLSRFFKRRIEGYTGDCLGLSQQLSELSIYLMLGIPLFAQA